MNNYESNEEQHQAELRACAESGRKRTAEVQARLDEENRWPANVALRKRIAEVEACLGDSQESLTVAYKRNDKLKSYMEKLRTIADAKTDAWIQQHSNHSYARGLAYGLMGAVAVMNGGNLTFDIATVGE